MKNVRITCLFAFLCVSAFAQTFRGDLAGTVTDATGAALAGAAIKVDNPSTGLSRSTLTGKTGTFLVAELPVGIYEMTVSMTGFENRKVTNIEISVAKTTNVPMQLGVAAQASQVEVSANAAALETTSSALVAVVDDKSVQEMPMNGRDFTQMVKLAPGVTPSGASINGMRTNGKNFQIDGADNNDAYSNAVAVNQGGVAGIAGALVPIEALDQFSVETNAGADAGRNGGGAVQMVIKSGTNSLHGSLFFFDRNEALASRSPVQTATSPKQEIRNNQFGFAAGGPIIKNKTFYFVTGEVQLAVAGLSILDTTPSPAWVSAATAVLQKYSLAVNPVSLKLLNAFPSSALVGPATANNYLATALNTYNSYNGIIKIDHRFNEKHTLAVRYLGGTGTQTADVGSNLKDYFQTAPMHVHNFSVVENDLWTPRMVNQVTLGVNYFLQTFNDYNLSYDPASAGLITGVASNISGAPKIAISGFDYVGATPPLGRTDVVGHLTDNLSYTVGRHQWKFGGEYRHANVDVAYFSNSRGTFNFDGTRGPWATDSTVSSALRSLSDFLLGEPSNSSGATIVRGNPERVYRVNSYDGWAHDTFQINSKLTVNFGVRYTYQGAPYVAGGLYNFVPSQGFVMEAPYKPSKANFSPRLGFAYTPSSKWVVRGGFGVFYDVPAISEFTAAGGVGNGGANGLAYNPVGSNAVYTLTAKNVVFTPGAAVFGTVAATPPFGAYSVNPNFTMPHIMNFNLNVQRQLTKSTLLQVGFVGSEGRKLAVILDINQLANGVRPYATAYPNLTAINQLNAAADSAFTSLQTSLRQQVWKGLSANINFTWGHALDDASTVTSPANSYNLKGDWGSSTFDTRLYTTSYITYEIPKAHFAPALTGGWQVNSLVTITSGNPINILAGSNISGSGENKDRVNLVGDPYSNIPVLTNTLAHQYFNPAAFAKPAAGSFGNLGRDTLYGPGFGSVDFSLFKNFPIFEKMKGQFRLETFNLFNRTNWANPTTTFTSSSFGQLTQTKNAASAPGLGFGEPRNIQLAMKIIF